MTTENRRWFIRSAAADVIKSGAALARRRCPAGRPRIASVRWRPAERWWSPHRPRRKSLDAISMSASARSRAIAALYDNLLEFKKIPDPKRAGAFREDIADHPDMPAGLAVQGKLAQSFELDPAGKFIRFPASAGREEQLGQRTHGRGREVDLGPQVRPEGDRRVLSVDAGPGQARRRQGRGQVHRLHQPRQPETRCWPSCSPTSTRRSTIRPSARRSPPADDPWARKFNREQFGPASCRIAWINCSRGQQAVFKWRPDYYLGKPAMDTVIFPRSADVGHARLAAAGRRGRHRAVSAAARDHEAARPEGRRRRTASTPPS